MTTVTRRLEFDYGHRVLGHEGKCRHLHGHRGVAEIEVKESKDSGLNGLGMVVDFSVIKEKVGGWIDENWDHNFLCHDDDPLVSCIRRIRTGDVFAGKAPYIMENGNPTAENMARELYDVSSSLLGVLGLDVVSVTIWETPSCRAVYRP